MIPERWDAIWTGNVKFFCARCGQRTDTIYHPRYAASEIAVCWACLCNGPETKQRPGKAKLDEAGAE
jgi:ribosome-binding protein aMBF1 (putative translation factor)